MDAAADEATTRRYLFRRFWTSRPRILAHAPGLDPDLQPRGVIVFNIGIQYRLNVWNRNFFDALENRDTASAINQGLFFPVLAAASIVLASWPSISG